MPAGAQSFPRLGMEVALAARCQWTILFQCTRCGITATASGRLSSVYNAHQSCRALKDPRLRGKWASLDGTQVKLTLAKRDEPRTAVLVLGMHRSGTSAVAGAVHLAGAEGPRTLMPPDQTNPLGFWESDVIVSIHEEMLAAMGSTWYDWQESNRAWLESAAAEAFADRLGQAVLSEFGNAPLFVLKDPRICRLLPFWKRILQHLNLRIVVFHVVRNPIEVARSLERRDGFALEHSCLLWLRHVIDADADSRSLPRYFLAYDQLVQNPDAVLESAGKHTGIVWPRQVSEVRDELASFARNELRRERALRADLDTEPRIVQWVKDTFDLLERLTSEQDAPDALLALDVIGQEFRSASRMFGAVAAIEKRPLSAKKQEQAEESRKVAAHLDEPLRHSEQREKLGRSAEHVRALEADLARQSARADAEQIATGLRLMLAELSAGANLVSREAASLRARLIDAGKQASEHQPAEAGAPRDLDGRATEIHPRRLAQFESDPRRAVAGTFDAPFYCTANPDVASSGIDPLEHFLRHGWREGRDPVPWFSMSAYLDMYPDVREAGLNAFHHYLVAGRHEGREARPSSSASSAARPASHGHDEAARTVRRALEPYFDREFYLARNSDVAAAGVDPLQHYIEFGWQEGRDPASGFATTDYLQSNSDVAQTGVNPFYHYLTTGKEQGRPARHPEGWRFRLIAQAAPSDHLRHDVGVEISRQGAQDVDGLLASIDAVVKDQRSLVVSLTHDDCKTSVGGIQLCLNIEEQLALHAGCTYLNLYPAQPLRSFRRQGAPDSWMLAVRCNGTACGTATEATVVQMLNRLVPRFERRDLVVHALMGHAPETVQEMYRTLVPRRALFWIHDFFALCPNHTLLRNDVTYCGAPAPDSGACGICAFGEERVSHLQRIRELFRNVPFTVVSPSTFAAEFACRRADFIVSPIVAPHCVVEDEDEGAACEDHDPAIRVAFLGHPLPHKGWETFVRIVEEGHRDQRYEYHHIGSGAPWHRGITFTRVSVIADGPAATLEALRRQHIDAAFLFSIWPETFSFAAHEALAAGALIITSAAAGNVACLARERGGIVLADEAAAINAFIDGTIYECAKEHRELRRLRAHLRYSSMSMGLLEHETFSTL